MKLKQGELRKGVWIPKTKPLTYEDYINLQKQIWDIEEHMTRKFRKIRDLKADRMSLGRKRVDLLNEIRERAGREKIKYGEEI